MVIGIDIGGTKIQGIVLDGKKIVREKTVPTPNNLNGFKDSLTDLAGILSGGGEVFGIGIGVAGLVHPNKGTVEASPNLPYLHNFNFVKFLKSKGFQNVKIQNDAKCFALAELYMGQAKNFKNSICITLGTGIGSGIIIGGKLYGGAQNGAGEIGHGFLTNEGDWESLYQRAKHLPKAGKNQKNTDHDFKTIAVLLGKALAAVAYTLDPEVVILGGSVTRLYYKKFLPQAVAMAKKNMALGRFLPKVLVSRLSSPGALGAALLLK